MDALLGNNLQAVAALKNKAAKILNISSANKASNNIADVNVSSKQLSVTTDPAERLRASFGVDKEGARLASATLAAKGAAFKGKKKSQNKKSKKS